MMPFQSLSLNPSHPGREAIDLPLGRGGLEGVVKPVIG
jgi:hypothetical protein